MYNRREGCDFLRSLCYKKVSLRFLNGCAKYWNTAKRTYPTIAGPTHRTPIFFGFLLIVYCLIVGRYFFDAATSPGDPSLCEPPEGKSKLACHCSSSRVFLFSPLFINHLVSFTNISPSASVLFICMSSRFGPLSALPPSRYLNSFNFEYPWPLHVLLYASLWWTLLATDLQQRPTGYVQRQVVPDGEVFRHSSLKYSENRCTLLCSGS